MSNLRTLRQHGTAGAGSCLLLWFILSSLPLAAQPPPSADTFVSSPYPTTNFGSVNSLAVSPGSTSYVQFNLGIIPAGATVSKATSRLYVELVTKASKFDVYQVHRSWSAPVLCLHPGLSPSVTCWPSGGPATKNPSPGWDRFHTRLARCFT
jgi:hypothetical protein